MKVEKINNAEEKFKPYKITIEISVENKIEAGVLYELKKRSDDLFLINSDGKDMGDVGVFNRNELDISEVLIKDILSNL